VKLTALASHGPIPEAVRAALMARGWDAQRSRFAAAGLQPVVLLIEDIGEPECEALVHWAAKAGTDVLTGDSWALVVAAASRLAPLARPDRVPPDLVFLTQQLGTLLTGFADPARTWTIRDQTLSLAAPVLIGILNVTPDSFSDGGRFTGLEAAVAQGERLKTDGAAVIDIGGESTRPGAAPVSVADETARVVPVIAELVRRGLGPVSVDTRKAAVARAALDAGAAIVNDVSGLSFDPDLGAVVRGAGAGLIVMHMRGTPDTMDALATYAHPAVEIAAELRTVAERAAAAGITPDRLALDPGFGFAKNPEQNFRVLDELATIVGLGYPVVVGPSRKRFLGAVTGRPVEDRDRATAVACALAWERGARLFRVHDVALAREALTVARAVAPGRGA
jgi:dihydropteroate synthase